MAPGEERGQDRRWLTPQAFSSRVLRFLSVRNSPHILVLGRSMPAKLEVTELPADLHFKCKIAERKEGQSIPRLSGIRLSTGSRRDSNLYRRSLMVRVGFRRSES
jgi:hypothetical protein